MSALYTFAVVDSHPPLRFDVSARLRVVTVAGLSAVVEPADVAEYEGERLERNLADLLPAREAQGHRRPGRIVARSLAARRRSGPDLADSSAISSCPPVHARPHAPTP